MSLLKTFQKKCADFFEAAVTVDNRRYRVEYEHTDYEIICPKYVGGADSAVIIPYFLSPGRKYPVQVYLYAVNLYATNPKMSQRQAAKETREKFGLQKFSHSTLCRVMKTLEAAIVEAEKAPREHHGGKGGHSGQPATENNVGQNEGPAKICRFPSVTDTIDRRKKIAAFIKMMSSDIEVDDIVGMSRIIVKKWHEKYMRLLI